jgi:EAL domain-containing protein (putative c-di-GMP-specific phosphodiesterase class I)
MSDTRLDPEDRLIDDLRVAVERDQITAFFQPQIDLATGAIVGVESLSRWLHPELGIQSPTVFIPLAEEFGFIDDIGDVMLHESCVYAADLARRSFGIAVAVNVSALQLARSSFFEHLEDCIAENSLGVDAITLEITESRFIANRPQVSERLSKVRAMGIGVSIDDFGVGHSSVEQVLALPANELKIDRTIVQDESASDGALLTTIVRLARDRGLRTVAEGIETEAQLARVREVGCDRAQGYLIGRPMPKDELDGLLNAELG